MASKGNNSWFLSQNGIQVNIHKEDVAARNYFREKRRVSPMIKTSLLCMFQFDVTRLRFVCLVFAVWCLPTSHVCLLRATT